MHRRLGYYILLRESWLLLKAVRVADGWLTLEGWLAG